MPRSDINEEITADDSFRHGSSIGLVGEVFMHDAKNTPKVSKSTGTLSLAEPSHQNLRYCRGRAFLVGEENDSRKA